MTAVVLIVVAGTGTIGDVNEDNEAKVAGQTFAQTDEAFQTFARQDRNRNRTVELPDSMNGNVEVRESSWRLRLNNNTNCASGTRGLGAMHYESEDQTVGYEGGGIWKVTQSGATMDTPPKMTYQDGSLSVRFPNISGNVTTSNRVSLSSNVTKQDIQNRKLTKALYTDLDYDESGSYNVVCPPNELEQATLWIENSQYASAWARYFDQNYPDRLVDVKTSKPIEPGDDVEVVFELGDVSDPTYEITDFDVSRGSSSGPMEVEAEITNTGGLDGEQDVEFNYSGGSNSDSDNRSDFAIDSGDSATVSFTVPDDDIEPSTTYTVEVRTGDDSKQVDIAFGSPAGTPNTSLDSSVPQNASTGADAEAKVDVENTGKMTAYENVEFQYKEASDTTWTSVGNETVTVDPASVNDTAFELPTESSGLYDWRVQIDNDSQSGQYAVGSDPYFSINETDNPSTVDAHKEFELDVTVRNIGHRQGQKDVEVTVEKLTASGHWIELPGKTFSPTIDGSVYPGTSETTLTYRDSFTDEGKYRYTINSTDETTSETFYVGPPNGPLLVVDSTTLSQNPAAFDSTVWFNATVENVGTAQAYQTVEVHSESGESVASKNVLVGVGETETVRLRGQITNSRFDAGPNSIEVTTENSSKPETLFVLENGSIEDGEDGVTVNREVEAEISVLGTELEGAGEDEHSPHEQYIIHAPVRMWLDVENDSHSESVRLWSDRHYGNVNHPRAEKAMMDDPGAYSYNRTFGAGSRISVFARSFTCWEYVDSGVTFENVMSDGQNARGDTCSNWGEERITISQDANSSNVVILGNGEEVPAFGAAEPYQRDLEQILGHRITDDGTLSLGENERVFLYELSDDEAVPEKANGTGDPDYNDAVALFRVVDIQRDVQTPPNFEIEDVNVPDHVAIGEPTQATVTVNNTGGSAGNTSVFFDLGGREITEEKTTTLQPGETETVTIDVPTDVDPGTYQYTVTLGANPQESQSGAITIGEVEGRNLQVTSLSAPKINESDESPVAEVKVTNTGTKRGDPTDVEVLNVDTNSRTTVKTGVDLEPGDATTFTSPLPSGSGEVRYRVDTGDSESPVQRIYYGDSDIHITNLAIGSSTYHSDGGLIEEQQAKTMQFKLENQGDIGGEREVEFTLEADNGTTVFSDSREVQIGQGRIHSDYPKWLSYAVDLDVGYYHYSLTVNNPDSSDETWQGELFVSNEVDAGDAKNSSSPISVDSNEVVISG